MLRLKAKVLDLTTKQPVVVLNERDARELGVHAGDRVSLKKASIELKGIVETTTTLVKEGEIGINRLVMLDGIRENDLISVEMVLKPKSIEYLKKKLRGIELSEEEIREIMNDIKNETLTDAEIAAFISAIYMHDYTDKEVLEATKCMVESGLQLDWKSKYVADKHSIGGVPGNRISPLVVAIVASAGILIPKSSSRAITSPAGTADTMEVFCDVSFSVDEIKRIVKRTRACLVWGGALDLAPIDDKLIRVEYPLALDPHGQVLASVLSKKKAMGSKQVVIDIPVGNEAKIRSLDVARAIAARFKKIGKALGMDVRCLITRGHQPIGRGIGPVLEAIDIMKVMRNDFVGLEDLKNKAVLFAGKLLEMCGKGDYEVAKKILESGKAYRKFREIVEAQNGSLDKDLVSMLGTKSYDVVAEKEGKVIHIDIHAISEIARRAGAPADKGAGVYMFVKRGDYVKKDQPLFRIYAEKLKKLRDALAYAKSTPVMIGDEKELLLKEV